MKILHNKIVEATENELMMVWLEREYDEFISFPEYLLKLHNLGTKITGKDVPGDGRETDPRETRWG